MSAVDTWLAAAKNVWQHLREHHPKKAAVVALILLYYTVKRATTRRKSVSGATVLITGGGSGLGRNLAKRFAAKGATVVLWDINERALNSVGKEIAQEGGRVWTYVCDVTQAKNVYEVAERVHQEIGRVDILINNAGIVSGDLITDIPDRKIEMTFQVNVLAHFWTIKSFLPAMLKENSGHIVTVASAAGLQGAAKLSDYCASKFAVVGLDEALRHELRRRGASGVKTTCVCPYYINTGMFDGVTTKFSWLLPILSEDYASSKIENAILTNQPLLCMPRIIYIVPLLKGLLPTMVSDWIGSALGINHGMDQFKGRK